MTNTKQLDWKKKLKNIFYDNENSVRTKSWDLRQEGICDEIIDFISQNFISKDELGRKIENLKEKKTILSQGGLRTTYMVGFENAKSDLLELIKK